MRFYLMASPSKIALIVGSVISVVLDQWSKSWAVETLLSGNGALPLNPRNIYGQTIEVFSWWNWRLVGNKGAAWGIFRDLPETWRVPFFVLIGVFAMGVLLTLYFKSHGQKVLQIGLILVFGGAIGNLIDRVQIGYVIDFIDWHYGGYHWPTFNIADVSISVGVGFLFIDMILQALNPPPEEEETDDDSSLSESVKEEE